MSDAALELRASSIPTAMTLVRSRTLAFAFALGLPLALAAAAPAQAGFFEDLFGIRENAEPPPRAVAPAPKPVKKSNAAAARDSAKKAQSQIEANLALKAAQAGKDPATLAVQDNTLRRGDIVSGPNGLMVYMGGDPEHPSEARFVPANDPNLEKRLRESLQGLKRPVAAPEAPKPVAQAPASPAQPVSVERDGKVIRVVGAYQGAQ
jgi:hypothetical protein